MLRGKNTRIGTHDPKNNFALKAHPASRSFADVGGQLEATLKVLHVARNAKHADKKPAYSVVVGQIHAVKDQDVINKGEGFGWGNEPIKIYYKKWPDHDTGSVFWTYERNLERDNPDRTDIAYPVWGNTWENPEDPGETASRSASCSTTTSTCTATSCTSPSEPPTRRRQVTYQIDLSEQCRCLRKKSMRKDQSEAATRAMPCTSKRAHTTSAARVDDAAMWYAACAGTGDWADRQSEWRLHDSVAFRRIQLTGSVDPKRVAREGSLVMTGIALRMLNFRVQV